MNALNERARRKVAGMTLAGAALVGTGILAAPGTAHASSSIGCLTYTAATPAEGFGGIYGNTQANCYDVGNGFYFVELAILWREDSNGNYTKQATGSDTCQPTFNGSLGGYFCNFGTTAFSASIPAGVYHTQIIVSYGGCSCSWSANSAGYYTVK